MAIWNHRLSWALTAALLAGCGAAPASVPTAATVPTQATAPEAGYSVLQRPWGRRNTCLRRCRIYQRGARYAWCVRACWGSLPPLPQVKPELPPVITPG